MGKAKIGALGGGSFGRPGRSDFDASVREGSGRIFVYLQPGLSAQLDSFAVMALGALCGVGESAKTTSASAAIALASVTSAGALMPERSGEPDKLLVMVLMVIGVPPFSMGGRNYGHELATHTLRLSLEVNFSFCLL